MPFRKYNWDVEAYRNKLEICTGKRKGRILDKLPEYSDDKLCNWWDSSICRLILIPDHQSRSFTAIYCNKLSKRISVWNVYWLIWKWFWRTRIILWCNVSFEILAISKWLYSAAKQQISWVVSLRRTPLTSVWPGVPKDGWLGLIRAPSDSDWNAIWRYIASMRLYLAMLLCSWM